MTPRVKEQAFARNVFLANWKMIGCVGLGLLIAVGGCAFLVYLVMHI